ncbi:galanin receptor type 1 [Exaiptasia diaphana]|uniref:G-protein coupled receptors family 1 profile domain-containing protein n=1 Tax=Exaiptasia diaphana TaxID=2652724 RepID=A0A913XSF1_EXADI|nr:galanin receptor type 1 [Exaiptasia diaphana]KXJ09216.1 Relaxin-3 receptor 1 [Exaiptasia diaphana]
MADAINCSFHSRCEQENVSSTNNPANNAQPIYYEESFPILLTKYFLLTLLILIGVIGNIVVVIVTTKRKAFNSSLDLFVKNLAIADLGFLLLVTPSGVLRVELPYQWPFGEYVCLYVFPMLDLFYGASVWTIAAIAIERYRNIVGMARVHRRERHTKRSVKILVVLVWCFSFVVFCIPVYVSVTYIKDPPICTVQWTDDPRQELLAFKIWLGFSVFLSYVLPLGVVIWTYVVISRQLSRSSTFLLSIKGIVSRKAAKNRRQAKVETVQSHEDQATLKSINNGNFPQSQRSPVDSSRLTQNRRAKNILTPVAVLFAVSMFPNSAIKLVLIFWTINAQPYYLIIFFIVIIFGCANSAFNPIVYCIVSREFRNAFKTLFNLQKERAGSRTSNGGFDHRESTDRRSRTIEFSCSHLGNDEQPAATRSSSRLFLACNTKL